MSGDESKAKNAQDTAIWDHNRGVIRSSIGGWVIGRGVMNRGYDMMDDFVGKLSYMQVVMFNVTGRIPERALADWFETVQICISWPDPRIWCNHIGALGGSVRASALASTVAGILATDARSYGIKPIIEGMEFIQRAKLDCDKGMTVEGIVKQEAARHGGKPLMMGYARPIAKGDERVPALERFREALGFPIGEHLALAFAINDYLDRTYSETININGYVAAFWSDHGFTPEEIYRIYPVAVASGVAACFVDTRDKPAETFLPLQCEDIDYQGVAERSVPDR
ncbi:MAG: hypothetical protein WDZ30_08950 [Cellvibrionaceae bacterium]